MCPTFHRKPQCLHMDLQVPSGLQLPGLLPPHVWQEDGLALGALGFSPEEITEALGRGMPPGGEPAARAHFAQWLQQTDSAGGVPTTVAYWDLPVSSTARAPAGPRALKGARRSRPVDAGAGERGAARVDSAGGTGGGREAEGQGAGVRHDAESGGARGPPGNGPTERSDCAGGESATVREKDSEREGGQGDERSVSEERSAQDLRLGAGVDPLAWHTLALPRGWTQLSHYLAVGCISARDVFAHAAPHRHFAGVCHRLLWREWHRLNAVRWGRRLFWLQGPGRVQRPWRTDAAAVEAWRRGRTGVPYIDACMRELRRTGWLAYKGRKTVGHFLVADLGVDWRVGACHFEEVLLDYDCAMNYGNWVTVARVDRPRRRGADWGDAGHRELASKLAAERANDPRGEYIRAWVPELCGVGAAHVHAPWEMEEAEMVRCGCVVGRDYPAPITGPISLSHQDR